MVEMNQFSIELRPSRLQLSKYLLSTLHTITDSIAKSNKLDLY